jgi:hypothetical protein
VSSPQAGGGAGLASRSSGARPRGVVGRGRGAGPVGLVELVPVVVLRLDVGDVQEAVAPDREVDERGLDRRLEVDDLPLVDVPGIALVAGALDVQLLEDAIFDDGDPAFLGLEHVDQHFFLHASIFLTQSWSAMVG